MAFNGRDTDHSAIAWNRRTIYKWQHGTTLPSIDMVLAAVLQVRVDDIIVISDVCLSRIGA
ncbi:MAG TPA: helix-turn-helix transcriptional regulator [Candidatus Pelethocola excrementipullorum]|nr:helix-turn-helix transcriptional regulator [Candidatus Pelethocola excrementipullorum]